MGRKSTTEEFIEKVKIVHKDKYNYSKVNYIGCFGKIEIICKIHGSFWQEARSHTSGHGCQQCFNERVSKINSIDQDTFINKAKEIHGNKYDYSKVKYIKSAEKILIICKKHGEFKQRASSHLEGYGCKKCGMSLRQDDWVKLLEQCRDIHSNKYDYSLVNIFLKTKEKQTIICPIHGKFRQLLQDHKLGRGCNKCAIDKNVEKLKQNPIGWSHSNWEKASKKSKNFDSYKVYIIKGWNENEEFYKIGRTFKTVEKRFKDRQSLPYNYKILQTIESENPKYICELEHKLKIENSDNSYVPKITFKGEYECFSEINWEKVVDKKN